MNYLNKESRRFYDFWLATRYKSTRDVVFKTVTDGFHTAPIRILDVGGIHSSYPLHHERYSDGWSAMFWCDYIHRNGGHIDLVEFDEKNIEISKNVLSYFTDKISIDFHISRGEEYLKTSNQYDLVYLDGSNDPNEMLQQYELCNKNSVVLCDDWNIKGKLCSIKYPNFLLFEFAAGHRMAFYYPGSKRQSVHIEDSEDQIKYQQWCYFTNFDDPKVYKENLQ